MSEGTKKHPSKETLSSQMELLLEFALLELGGMTLSLKRELDLISDEHLQKLTRTFEKIGTKPNEVLFLEHLANLKKAKKILETHKNK